jgi:hypothetical protein
LPEISFVRVNVWERQTSEVRYSCREYLCMRVLIISLFAWLLIAYPASAADTKSQLTMLINERGAVEVVDRWSGLKQESGVYEYFSAAREVGTVPVEVRDFGFTLSFATRSYLRYEEGVYHFVTPDFYYAEGPLDVELTLTYPPNLQFIEANFEPTYVGEGVLAWSLPDCSHSYVMARFERTGPFVQPGRTGPEFQVDPMTLMRLTADELPATADDVLKELENIIVAAEASSATDPDFTRVLRKLLAKFYYILDSNGLLLDYRLPKTEEEEQLDELASGIIESAGGATQNRGEK